MNIILLTELVPLPMQLHQGCSEYTYDLGCQHDRETEISDPVLHVVGKVPGATQHFM